MGCLEDWFLNLDMYPKRLNLFLPNGKDKYQTGSGFLCSMLVWLIMLLYISNSITQIVEYEDQKEKIESAEPYL